MFANLIPRPLIRFFASPYVAGDSLEDAIDVAHQLIHHTGLHATLDLLAEEVDSQSLIDRNRETYRAMIRGAGTDPRFEKPEQRPSISIKLSSFTLAPLNTGGDAAGSAEAVQELADYARELSVPLTIDMEDSPWTSLTLAVSTDLFRRGYDVGTVLQSRLRRTEQDIATIPEGMRVRTVIGIYPEPQSIASTNRKEMKDWMIQQSAALLERGVYVELATHDEACIRRFLSEVIEPRGVTGDRYEIQMLYGVPRAAMLRELVAGRLTSVEGPAPKARLYVPFATHWDQATAYCRRRLKNNPDLALYVLRNLAASLGGKRAGISLYMDGSQSASG